MKLALFDATHISSIYEIFTYTHYIYIYILYMYTMYIYILYIYIHIHMFHKLKPNVGTYSIHGGCGKQSTVP